MLISDHCPNAPKILSFMRIRDARLSWVMRTTAASFCFLLPRPIFYLSVQFFHTKPDTRTHTHAHCPDSCHIRTDVRSRRMQSSRTLRWRECVCIQKTDFPKVKCSKDDSINIYKRYNYCVMWRKSLVETSSLLIITRLCRLPQMECVLLPFSSLFWFYDPQLYCFGSVWKLSGASRSTGSCVQWKSSNKSSVRCLLSNQTAATSWWT